MRWNATVCFARAWLAAALATFCIVCSRTSAAQTVPVFLVASSADDPSQAMSAMNRVGAALGPDARYGTALAREVAERYGRASTGGDRLAGARAHARAAENAFTEAFGRGDQTAIARASSDLEAAANEFDTSPDGFDASRENVAAVQELMIFIAMRYDRAGDAVRSAEYVRRLARIDPALELGPTAVPSNIRQLYTAAAATLPRGALAIESSPPGCAVIRDGQTVGSAPIELQDLPEGRHRIQLRCGATYSLVHPVDVAGDRDDGCVLSGGGSRAGFTAPTIRRGPRPRARWR